jgi:Zn-dependent M28 family amino/carboxypeptidase
LQPAGHDGAYFQLFGPGYRNILGIIPGSDPALSNQFVLISAHYDHVGYGTRRNSNGPIGYIHNGADDNASGTAAVLELVEAFQRLAIPPRRSVLFVLWDGEEKGLLGSLHWLSYPTVALENVRLMINLDMVRCYLPAHFISDIHVVQRINH